MDVDLDAVGAGQEDQSPPITTPGGSGDDFVDESNVNAGGEEQGPLPVAGGGAVAACSTAVLVATEVNLLAVLILLKVN